MLFGTLHVFNLMMMIIIMISKEVVEDKFDASYFSDETWKFYDCPNSD